MDSTESGKSSDDTNGLPTIGKCYKLRSYAHRDEYLSNKGTYAFNSDNTTLPNVWKIGAGADGER